MKQPKQYFIRKVVIANDIKEAMRKESEQPITEICENYQYVHEVKDKKAGLV